MLTLLGSEKFPEQVVEPHRVSLSESPLLCGGRTSGLVLWHCFNQRSQEELLVEFGGHNSGSDSLIIWHWMPACNGGVTEQG